MIYTFTAAVLFLVIFGYTSFKLNKARAIIDFTMAFFCIISIILLRFKTFTKIIPVIQATGFGAYCIYLLYDGSLNLWVSAWILAFPLVAIYFCHLTVGLAESLAVFAAMIIYIYSPMAPYSMDNEIKLHYMGAYILVTGIGIAYERLSIKKDEKEATLKAELACENEMVQVIQNNIPQGIFLMNREFRILPGYSKPLVPILSYYDTELTGKNFLDILSSSLDAKQLQSVKSFLEMIFEKSKDTSVLESVNPLSEFAYKADDRKKTLTANFHLAGEKSPDKAIMGIIQDISREKGFEKELHDQRESQEQEMKNMFDIIQIDPLVFQDFMEDADSNFNYINFILKDRTLSEKQVINKFFQNIHAIKTNALILGMESFARKLHAFEDDIKVLMAGEAMEDDILRLAIKLEGLMSERDNYNIIVKKIEAFKNSNQVDTILVHTMNRAVEKTSAAAQKKVELRAGYLDLGILESRLRRPIKDILFQCVRNSIYHGIETVEERIRINKRPQGLLTFSINNVGGKAEVSFSDDGRGLDWKKIKETYIRKHPEIKNPGRKILMSSIFSPEFSTAAETDMAAGRGVGLSIVKDLIKQNHGTIKVDSSESGLTIKFALPMPK